MPSDSLRTAGMRAPAYGLALRLVSALRLGARLVCRPRRGVAHVYRGPLTASGRFVPAGASVECGAATRRLGVLLYGVAELGPGLRLCRRCALLLSAFPPGSPWDGRLLVTLDEKAEAFSHLTLDDFETAARWCRTVEETHQVGALMGLVHGPPPFRPATEAGRRHRAVDVVLNERRRRLRLAELSPEEQSARRRQADIEADEQARLAAAYAKDWRIARLERKARRGHYLLASQRAELADHAGT